MAARAACPGPVYSQDFATHRFVDHDIENQIPHSNRRPGPIGPQFSGRARRRGIPRDAPAAADTPSACRT